MRIHRSVRKRMGKVDPVKVANRAEDYLEGLSLYRGDVKGVGGLVSADRVRAAVKKIDVLERDMLKLEDKLDRLAERRAVEAVKLEEYLIQNLDVLGEYLEPEELQDFR